MNACIVCQTWPCICVRPETEEYGGAKRDKENIPDYRLIPHTALKRLAARYTHGKIKYGGRNWESGTIEFYRDCLNRAYEHLGQYCSGDTTEDHLAAAAWNIFAVMFAEEGKGEHL